MLNERLDLINTKINVKVEDKTLTENLKVWRKDRNITKHSYIDFVENILEELLEPLYDKQTILKFKKDMIKKYFPKEIWIYDSKEVIDAIQDIQVFCINETELMGYDNVKCNNEVFKHINCRKQDPSQMIEWKEKGAYGKWKKWSEQPEEEIYQPDYESCKL